MNRQMLLPGIPRRSARADIRARVAYKLMGLELRQQWREQKRKARRAKGKRGGGGWSMARCRSCRRSGV